MSNQIYNYGERRRRFPFYYSQVAELVDARISGEVRRVIHRRYHIHAYRFESCPDNILVFDTALPLGTAIRQNRIQGRYDSLERQAT